MKVEYIVVDWLIDWLIDWLSIFINNLIVFVEKSDIYNGW